MKTIFEHSQSNVLVIPQALFAMKDVTVLKHHQNSVIFHKILEQDLVDIEFYINAPCFIYVESGREKITNGSDETITLNAESAIFFSQGLNLYSDFVRETESLKAYLVFFDDDVITNYLSHVKNKYVCQKNKQSYCLIEGSRDFLTFFDSIRVDINDAAFINIKLQELLHLIAWKAHQNIFHTLLFTLKRVPAKQNLARLLEKPEVLHLTVNDLAHLSGRSLSSFNRDFKKAYKVPPKRWLVDKRLSLAKKLLEGKEFSVTEVAFKVGYENVSNFIKAFKLKYGLTPKQIKLHEW